MASHLPDVGERRRQLAWWLPPSEKEVVRANGQNMPLGGWEMLGKFRHLSGLLSCCMSSALFLLGKRNGDKYTAKWERWARVWTHPGERALEVQILGWVGVGRQCSLTANTQALELDRVRASPADGQLLTICIEQVASLF